MGMNPLPRMRPRPSETDLILDNGLNLEAWFGQFVEQTDAPHEIVSDGVDPVVISDDAYAG